jgi:hypothetical protein
MQCLVLVKFLDGGSLSPEEFFSRVGAQWNWVDYGSRVKSGNDGSARPDGYQLKAKEAICIADYESVEQITIDLAIMPGAGISAVEVYPISEYGDVLSSIKDMFAVKSK